MKPQELDALKKLNIPVKKWGSSYRVKVQSQGKRLVTVDGSIKFNNRGRTIYIGNVSSPKSIEAISKYYKVKQDKLRSHLNGAYKTEKYKHYQGVAHEWNQWEYISLEEFGRKLESLMHTQSKAFKVNIQLGYLLVDTTSQDLVEREYWPSSATAVFDKPIAVNSKRDISSIVDSVVSAEHAERVRYPSSSWKFKEIYAYKVMIYYRDHILGENINLPDRIKNNRFIKDFPNSENKCVFYCIAYHLSTDPSKNHRRMKTPMKNLFKDYCQYKNIEFTNELLVNSEPVDILQFDELEECFNVNIDVFEMNEDTLEISKIRESELKYSNTMNILDYKGHAMYISDLEKVIMTNSCTKCGMIFDTCRKLLNHRKNKCEIETIERFVEKPTKYRPYENTIKSLLRKYNINKVNHYMDHFIVYDFEVILKETDIKHGENTTFTNRHIPVSVSICDSLTMETRCFVNDDVETLLKDMFDYIYSVLREIREYNELKFEDLKISFEDKVQSLTENASPEAIREGEKYSREWDEISKVLEAKGTSFTGMTIAAGKLRKKFPAYDEYCRNIDYVVKDKVNLEKFFNSVPVIGFNSGRYDLNVIKKDLFKLFKGSEVKAIKNPNYMCISTGCLKMMDISNYLPAGTSYESYLSTYLGECKCDNKIQCTCELGKGLFCYEYITSFGKLNETELPPQSAFDSQFKGTECSDEDYERLRFVWNHYSMKTVKDLLIWYNNLDVTPFVKAIKKQRDFYKKYKLDMFIDAVSLPGLAEKIMYQTCYRNLEPITQIKGEAFEFPIKRFKGYKYQDEQSGRKFALTLEYLNKRLAAQKYSCIHCLCSLNEENVSADRIDNSKGHIDKNVMITCIDCNVARKDMNIKAFQYLKLVEANQDKVIYSIDEENKDIYQKMKDNIAGGPSIIFNRYAKRFETYIRNENGKLVKKIIGYDANALYLWAIGNYMPCGRLTTIEPYENIVDDIRNDKIFGFLECDIETPEHLKEYFSEMTPIFKNIEINPDDVNVIGQHMFNYNQNKGSARAKKSKKLIGSYFGKKILVYTPLLKWYLSHGMVITNTYSFIKASCHCPFKKFAADVSNARRAGNLDKTKKVIGDMMKLVGNSAFGRSGMDKSKHRNVKYVNDEDKSIRSIVEHFNFHDLEELDEVYEVTENKRSIKLNNPIHMSIAIYQLAKLRMLQFYYDCIDFYFDRSDFQYQEMDTDSAYISFSDEHPFPNLIKPELRQHFEAHKHEWFPRDDSKKNLDYDTFTPGLFKEEWRGDAIVSLSSKNYICYLPDEVEKKNKKTGKMEKIKPIKISAKGVQKSKNADVLSPENFESVVQNRITLNGTNKGFRLCKDSKSVITYEQHKTALNYWYDKRQVLSDGISTKPLPI